MDWLLVLIQIRFDLALEPSKVKIYVPFIDLKLAYQVNGGTIYIDTIPGQIATDIPYTFKQTQNLLAEGTYNFKVWLVGANDDNVNNDTLRVARFKKPSPLIDFSFITACAGVGVPFTATASVTPGSIARFEWDFGDGDTTSLQAPMHRYDTSGTYTVTLRAYSNEGCYSSISKAVTITTTPKADFNALDACVGQNVVFINKSKVSSGSMSYLWNFGDGTTSTLANPSKKYTAAGTYQVKLVVSNAQSCSDSLIKSITIHALPEISFASLDPVCVDASSFSLTGGLPKGGVYTGTGVNVSTGKFSPSVAGVGNHTITYTFTNENGCVNTTTQVIQISASPVVNAGANQSVCQDEAAFNLTAFNPAGGSWSGIGVDANGLFTPSQAGAGTHTLTYTITQGGCTGTATKTITVTATPMTPIASANTPAYGENLELSTNEVPGASYQWTGPKGFTSNEQNPVISGVTTTAAGTYSVKITFNGCTSQAGTVKVILSGKASQSITFTTVSSKTYGDAPFELSAASSSGEPVSFTVVSGPATLSGSTLTLTGAGEVKVKATQGGSANYNPAEKEISFTVVKGSQTISFPTLASKVYGDAPFELSATASSSEMVSFEILSGPATLAGNTLTLTGAGQVIVKATQSGNTNYHPAVDVTQSFTVEKAAQSISFAALANRSYGDADFNLTATASSGLAITYTSSNPQVATVSGNKVTIVGAGTTTITASQNGNENYLPATTVEQLLTVNKASSTITFDAIASKTYGDAPFELQASASFGAVSFVVVSGPATISGTTLTITGAGQVTAKVTQAGNANYQASEAEQTFTVNKASQEITFTTLINKTYGDADFTLAATASSGLSLTYQSSDPSVAIVTGNMVTIVGAGTTTITASQEGNTNYETATDKNQLLVVNKTSQTITFAPLEDKTYGDVPFNLSAIASSDLVIEFSIVSGPATLNGNVLTLTGAGIVTVKASQKGNTNYSVATEVTQSITVHKATQTILFDALTNKRYGNESIELTASATSNLPVEFIIVSGPATINGYTLTITGAGEIKVRASQKGNENYQAALDIEQILMVDKATQTITFNALSDKNYGDEPFTLNATTNSGLSVSYISSNPQVAIVTGNKVTIVGAGSTTITASQEGNTDYLAATSVSQVLVVNKALQSITFATIPDKKYGDVPFSLSASASSGEPVAYSIVSGPATINGITLTITGSGKVIVRASQEGNSNYEAATNVEQSFNVNKASQLVSFDPILDKAYGDAPFDLHASSSSGLEVSFAIVSGPATINDHTVTLTGAGTVIIRATQGGNSNYLEAIAVEHSFSTSKASQSVSFATLPVKTYGDAAFELTATASSNLAVTYTSSNPEVATISGSIVTIVGAGTVTITASQEGNPNYNTATSVSQMLTINKASQNITFAELTNRTYGDIAFELAALSSSNLPVSFTIVSGPATLDGNTLTLTGAGTVTIKASQEGNNNYLKATEVIHSFAVQKASQSIVFEAIADKTFGDQPFNLDAQASSSLPVIFTVVSGPATVIGNTLSINGVGEIKVQASQVGNADYNPALDVQQSFRVAIASQTITFTAVGDKTYGDAPFELSATSSSGEPLSFTIISGPATISGSTLTLTGAGEVVVKATQSGSANYNPAEEEISFTVAKGSQTITFPALAGKVYGDTPFEFSATASSGEMVSFEVVSGPAILSDNKITLTGAGQVTIKATQAGNANYHPAMEVTQSFTVEKASQSISFDALASKSYGDAAFALAATASSGLTITYTSSNPQVATVSGNMVTIVGAGTTTITASQAGNENYHPASILEQLLTVSKANSTISFEAIASKTYGDAPFELKASASSGVAVSFVVVSGPATISGTTLTITGAGEVTVKVIAAENSNHQAAEVEQSFTINKATPLSKTNLVSLEANSHTPDLSSPPLSLRVYSEVVNESL